MKDDHEHRRFTLGLKCQRIEEQGSLSSGWIEFGNYRLVIVEWDDKLLNKTADHDTYQLWMNDTPPNAIIKYLWHPILAVSKSSSLYTLNSLGSKVVSFLGY